MPKEQHTIDLLSKLIFINEQGVEMLPAPEHIEKMLALCKKRSRPSYYKLRHASIIQKKKSMSICNIMAISFISLV